MYVSILQKSEKDPVFAEELLRNIIPLAGLGLLHKVGWALDNEQIFTIIRCEAVNV